MHSLSISGTGDFVTPPHSRFPEQIFFFPFRGPRTAPDQVRRDEESEQKCVRGVAIRYLACRALGGSEEQTEQKCERVVTIHHLAPLARSVGEGRHCAKVCEGCRNSFGSASWTPLGGTHKSNKSV